MSASPAGCFNGAISRTIMSLSLTFVIVAAATVVESRVLQQGDAIETGPARVII